MTLPLAIFHLHIWDCNWGRRWAEANWAHRSKDEWDYVCSIDTTTAIRIHIFIHWRCSPVSDGTVLILQDESVSHRRGDQPLLIDWRKWPHSVRTLWEFQTKPAEDCPEEGQAWWWAVHRLDVVVLTGVWSFWLQRCYATRIMPRAQVFSFSQLCQW